MVHRLEVPMWQVGPLIGSEGHQINTFQKEHKVKIQIVKKAVGDQVVAIAGEKANVQRCEAAISEFLQGLPEKRWSSANPPKVSAVGDYTSSAQAGRHVVAAPASVPVLAIADRQAQMAEVINTDPSKCVFQSWEQPAWNSSSWSDNQRARSHEVQPPRKRSKP